MPTLNARTLMIALGVTLVAVAALADALGLGQSARFGWKQGVVVSVGLALVAGGALWGRAAR